jgi:hypothetical protein
VYVILKSKEKFIKIPIWHSRQIDASNILYFSLNMWEKHVWYQLSMERRFFVYRHFSWQLLYINKGHLFFITSYFVEVFHWLCNNINESTILFIHFLNWVLIVWWNFQPWHGLNILMWCLAMRCCKISNKLSICFIYQK